MENRLLNIILFVICNTIPYCVITFTSKTETALGVEICLFFMYYVYLIIKYKGKYIDKWIMITGLILLIIEGILSYFVLGSSTIVSFDLSNISEVFGVFSFFIIGVLSILIIVTTNMIKMCIKRIRLS